jgi:hypothetical protein
MISFVMESSLPGLMTVWLLFQLASKNSGLAAMAR